MKNTDIFGRGTENENFVQLCPIKEFAKSVLIERPLLELRPNYLAMMNKCAIYRILCEIGSEECHKGLDRDKNGHVEHYIPEEKFSKVDLMLDLYHKEKFIDDWCHYKHNQFTEGTLENILIRDEVLLAVEDIQQHIDERKVIDVPTKRLMSSVCILTSKFYVKSLASLGESDITYEPDFDIKGFIVDFMLNQTEVRSYIPLNSDVAYAYDGHNCYKITLNRQLEWINKQT